MSRMYTAVFEAVAVTAAQDFFEVNPASNKPCRFVGLFLSQSSDTGDSAEEILRITITRVPATFTSGSGGSSYTPRLVDATGAAAGAAVEINNTTVATTSGTLENLMAYQFNIRTGLELWLPPEQQFMFVNGAGGVVRLAAAPADSLTMSGTLWFEELG